MDDIDMLSRDQLAQLTEEDKLRLVNSFVEFVALLEEAFGPASALTKETLAIARSRLPIAGPPTDGDEQAANVYLYTQFLPNIETTMVPKLRARIARNKVAEKRRQFIIADKARIREEIARLQQEAAEMKHQLFVAHYSSDKTRRASQFPH